MGHYSDDYDEDYDLELERIKKSIEYKQWLIWKHGFMKKKISELTVKELLAGIERLKEFDDIND